MSTGEVSSVPPSATNDDTPTVIAIAVLAFIFAGALGPGIRVSL